MKSVFGLAMPVAALAGLIGSGFAQEANGPKAPVVSFSKDERVVSIKHAGRQWEFVRPVVCEWGYTVEGRSLWVSPEGNDADPGTKARPLRTISGGIERAQAGDIVFIQGGNYVEHLLIRKSGAAGKPIILSCAPGDLGRVKVTPPKEYVAQNPSGAVVTLQGATYVWINGLVIEGPLGRPEAPSSEMYGANGITWASKAGPGCRVTNCVVYANVHCGLKEMGHGGSGILMRGNVVFGNGTRSTDHGIYCPADSLTIDGNIIFANAGYGIHAYSEPRHQVITRNLCIENKVCGIILAGSRNVVYHNVCVGNGIGIMYFRGGCTDNIVKNNVFAFNARACGYDNGGGQYGDPARNVDDFNCYFPGKPDERIRPGAHEVYSAPLFVAPEQGDFRLTADCPCRRKGANVGLPFQGELPDLGAFPTGAPAEWPEKGPKGHALDSP